MDVNCRLTDRGMTLVIEGKVYDVQYPKNVWDSVPEELKKVISNNYSFLKTIHLPYMLKTITEINYKTDYPIFKNSICSSMFKHIPFCADVDSLSVEKSIKEFSNLNFKFNDYTVNIPNFKHKLKNQAIINMSFGKDSLLTYGLAKEIGLNPILVVSLDNDCSLENQYKLKIIEKFSKEFDTKIHFVNNNTGVIHRFKNWGMPYTEWGFGHLITELCYHAIFFAIYHKANTILIGNEKGCNEYYINDQGYKCYPVYDQTSEWMIELANMTKTLTNNQLVVSSLVEPLNDLAIMKILHHRYPNIAKYQMSCFPDDNEHGKDHYWCEHCTKCARTYIYMLAINADPKKIGFQSNMLDKKSEHLYPLFGIKRDAGQAMGWELSGLGKEEQLYAFYLAYKNNYKGYLIEKFKKLFLFDAKKSISMFEKEYFGVHNSKTIQSSIKDKIYSIFNEELKWK